MAKSWTEKYNTTPEPVVKVIEKKFADIQEGEKMLIATPRLIDEYIRQIPAGHEVDLKTMRKDLALEHLADNACPVTTGIFLRIVAEKAHEEFVGGKPVDEITPFWRILNKKSPASKKLTFGVDFINEQREKEGFPG